MFIDATAAMWFLPFIAPICFYVCYTDMSRMKITNVAVMAVFAVFVVVGIFVLPLDVYLWRYTHLIVVLLAGMALNATGAVGAGDAKFAAAAAPFIHLGDLQFLMFLFAGTLIAALVTHRAARATSFVRNLTPNWVSWTSGARFPMGLALGGSLVGYLWLGAFHGA